MDHVSPEEQVRRYLQGCHGIPASPPNFAFALFRKLGGWDPRLRRQGRTPVVTGTVLLLIAITTMTLAFDMISDPPEGTASAPVLICAIATLVTIAAIALRVSGFWRLWVMTIGVGVGWIVAALLGIYDLSRLSEVPWIGVPVFAWPGFIVQFDADFWLFLVVVLFVMLITTIESASDMVAVQAVSWRRPRAIDFRAVQGAVNACALSNLLSGIAGGMPTATYGGSCASLIELTGVGARNVGVSAGIVFILLAFLPKVTALLVSIPSPVIAAYVMVLAALLFMQGVRIIAQDGLDYRKSIIAGLALLVGAVSQGIELAKCVQQFIHHDVPRNPAALDRLLSPAVDPGVCAGPH